MTDMEKLFCREYLVDFNATQAAIRAGYSPTSARQIATVMLDKPHIKAELKRTVGKVMERAEIDAAEVLANIKAMAEVDPCDVFNEFGFLKPLSLIPKHARLCISGIKNSRYGSSVTLEGRLKALEMLGKYLKLWQDGININTGSSEGLTSVVFDFTGETRGPGDIQEPAPQAEPTPEGPPADMWT